MDSLALIHLHLALECVGVDARQQLYRIPCAEPDTLHRVYAARHAGGEQLFFRHDLPADTRAALAALPFEAFFRQPERVQAVLALDRACEEIHIGKSYIYPEDLRPVQFPQVFPISKLDPAIVRRFDQNYRPGGWEAYALLVEGEIVASCGSSRENDAAGEAYVYTAPAHRGRGYARQAAAAWGFHLQRQGKVPFYSHRLENLASQSVARGLGLIQYLEDAGYA